MRRLLLLVAAPAILACGAAPHVQPDPPRALVVAVRGRAPARLGALRIEVDGEPHAIERPGVHVLGGVAPGPHRVAVIARVVQPCTVAGDRHETLHLRGAGSVSVVASGGLRIDIDVGALPAAFEDRVGVRLDGRQLPLARRLEGRCAYEPPSPRAPDDSLPGMIPFLDGC